MGRFDVKVKQYKEYKKVKANVFAVKTAAQANQCAKEAKMRYNYTKTFYRGKLDRGHAIRMLLLAQNLGNHHKVNCPLDMLVMLDKAKVHTADANRVYRHYVWN